MNSKPGQKAFTRAQTSCADGGSSPLVSAARAAGAVLASVRF
jgi:hypothetical protein